MDALVSRAMEDWAFRVTARKGETPTLVIEESSLARKDVSCHLGPDVSVLVIGFPYAEGPSWVTAADVALAYRAAGSFSPETVHGFFSIAVHDKVVGRVLVATDRTGCYDVFYRSDEGQFMISDSVECLASSAVRLTLDMPAILEFMKFGQMLRGKTHFREIRKMRCSSIFDVGPDGSVDERTYWSFADGECPREGPISDENVLGAFARHMDDCFAISESLTISLTGGMDSNSVLAACLPNRERVRCFAYGDNSNRDVRRAIRNCAQLGIPLGFYGIDGAQQDIPSRALDTCVRTNGMFNFILFSHLEQAYSQEARYADTLLTGIGTDIFRAYWSRKKRGSALEAEDIIPRALSKWRVDHLGGLVACEAGEPDAAGARATLASELTALEMRDDRLAAEYLCLRERAANFSTYIVSIAGRHLRAWDTWMYAPLLHEGARVSFERRLDESIQRKLIQRFAPALAREVTSGGEIMGMGQPSLAARLEALGVTASDYYRKSVNKMARVTIRTEPVRRHYTVEYADVLRRSYGGFVKETLEHGDMILQDSVDRDLLAERTDLFLRGCRNLCYSITNLMCLELWLKRISGLAEIRLPERLDSVVVEESCQGSAGGCR
jgi:hypothetical protein